MIDIKHLRKEYENVTPLTDVNAHIDRGEVISVIGPSGTGKSTLLRCLNQIEAPTSGEVWFEGECITKPGVDMSRVRQRMGMVFQSFNLFAHKPVVENVMMAPVDLLGAKPQDAYDEALDLLGKVGLADRALNYPDQLSGGQRQRVAIARTLAMHPEVVLLDEPTSALDPGMISEVLGVVTDLAKQGLTMLIVTHEMRFARDVSTRIFYMDQGEIYEDGTPEQVFEHPQRELTQRFIFRIRSWEWDTIRDGNDYYGLAASLQEFCRKQFLSPRQSRNIQLLVEEVMFVSILPAYKNTSPKVKLLLDCAEQGSRVKLRIDYPGLERDPLAQLDEIATNLLSRIASRIDDEDGTYAEFVVER